MNLTYWFSECVLQDGIPTSLLKLSTENQARAVKMFGGVQKYMTADGPNPSTEAQRLEIASKLLHQVIRRPELKDELYMQARPASLALERKRSFPGFGLTPNPLF